MNVYEGLALGVLQGLTEFLPVSSSGHLVIAEKLLKLDSAKLLPFDVLLHAATGLVVCVFFRKEIASLFGEKRGLLPLIVLACVPAGLSWLVLKDFFSELRASTVAVGVAFLIGSAWMLVCERFAREKRKDPAAPDAALVGLAQAAALLPGLSRSGAAVAGGALSGLTREAAFSFAFLTLLPLVGGAMLVEAARLPDLEVLPAAAGFLAACVSGWFGLTLFRRAVIKGRLWIFALYCAGAGIFCMVFSWMER